ncbi:ELWxxDGT repeat protein [Pyxidicoccus sp. 3LG]
MQNGRRLLGWLCVSFVVLGACSEPAAPKREEALASTPGALAAPPQVVRDINLDPARHFQPIAPTAMAALGDRMLFTALGSGGYELWMSDGTVAGTRLVRDILPGEESSSPEQLTPMGGHVYFLANDGRTGKELWRSDGTPEGTVLVKDIYPGSESSFATHLTPLGNGVLLFSAHDGVHGVELWRTDGTEAGTVMVKDISWSSSSPLYLTEVPALGLVFFRANDGTTGRELWRTDGTEAGTVLVQDLVPGRDSSDTWNLEAVGSSLFFRARTAEHGDELWRTDGTPNSITLVKDLVPGTGSSTVKEQVVLGDILYFTRVGQNVHELWRSDGTDAGTHPITATPWSTLTNCALSGVSGVSSLTAVPSRGLFFFYAYAGSNHGCELWKSDGTEAGTAMLEDIKPGAFSSLATSFVEAQGLLYFEADDGTAGRELWRSDGTAEGTRLVEDIRPGSFESRPSNLAAGTRGSRLFFQATTNDGFPSLWVSEGDEVNTQLLRLNRRQTDSSKPAWLTEWQGNLYFAATNRSINTEPWRTDGTSEGTRMVKDIVPDFPGSAPYLFVKAGEQLFFRADDDATGEELWRTDGTPEGTRLVKDIRAGWQDASLFRMLPVGDTVYFGANDGTHGLELWKSDGTSEGTRMVKDIRAGADNALTFTPELVELEGTLYFIANDGTHAEGLWRTDGTEEGTRLVADISVDINSGSTNPAQLTRAGGLIYFVGHDATHGFELWRSDGTEEGTRLVADLTPGDSRSFVSGLSEWNGALYFTIRNGAELWRTDGTAAGTVRLLNSAQAHPDHATAGRMVGVGRWLFFTASDATHSVELWRTDGTVEGTRRVRDIAPGPTSARPRNLVGAGGRLYFVASDGVHGQEVWVTDGSEASTELVVDLAPGAWSSAPANLTAAGGRLYFTADDGTQGVELWSVPLSAPSDTTPPSVTCPASVIAEATSAAGAAVDYPPATAVDDLTVEPTLGYSHARGSTFPLGTTQVLVTALDEVGNAATCTFDVTVRDTTPPALTCPADIVAEAVTAGSVHVSYPPATVSDAVTPESELTVFFNPLSGNRFFLGATPVWASVTDTAGNRAECTFTVTVVQRALAIACDALPATEATSPQGAIVYLPPEIVRRTDGSFPSPLTVTFNPASNTQFPKGFTPVTAHARDSWGAEGTCTFNAEVRDSTPPAISCAPFMEFEATSSAGAVADVPVPTWQDVASTSVTFNYSPAPGSTFPLGATPRQATATDEAGNISNICTTYVIVKDSTPPAVTCGPDVTVEATGPNGAAVTYAPPAATDAVTAAPTLSFSHESGSVFPVGVTPVTVTARDGAGNTGTCTFRVTVSEPPPPPSITCPLDVVAEAAGPEGAPVTFPAATASGGRTPVALTYSHESGSGFAFGTTSVTATVRDADGRTASCAFNVTVSDTTPPEVGCSANVTAEAEDGSGAPVVFSSAVAQDAVTPLPSVTTSHAPGGLFPLGTTEVVTTATDDAGNVSSCSFTVTVSDTTAPLITCPADISTTTSSPDGKVVHFPAPTAGDPVSTPVVSLSHESGSRFPRGTTPVVATATDAAGNSATCTFQVTVTRRNPVTAKEVEGDQGFGCAAGTGAPLGLGWSGLLLLGCLARRRGARRG